MSNDDYEKHVQMMRLRGKVAYAEQQRKEGGETFCVAGARKCLKERAEEDVRKFVLAGLEQSKQGKIKDFNSVCDRLEKKYTECEKID